MTTYELNATCGTTKVSVAYSRKDNSHVYTAKVTATGAWNNTWETKGYMIEGNLVAEILVSYMNAYGIPNDGCHHNRHDMLNRLASWMETNEEQDLVTDLPYLIRWDKQSNEVIFVLPTIRANVGCVMTYCHSTCHGEVSVDWLADRSKVVAYDATNEVHKASFDNIWGVFHDLYTNPYFGQVSRLVLKSKLVKAYTDIAWNEAHVSHRKKAKGL